ncbi:MAG: YncE family protein [SAR202 cluster bacterium]|nr:YncE family protein [SAR202 cluster bacterium]
MLIRMKNIRYWFVALLALVGLLAAACGGVSQKDYDALETQLQDQKDNAAPSILVQAGQMQPVLIDAAPTGWDTEASIRSKAKLLATYDSTGPGAWDPAEHPTVFITSEGKGYGSFTSETYKAAGFQMIDAVTKEIVASAAFDLGYELMGTPHGLGMSPDGRWIYVPTADGDQPWSASGGAGRILVVDSKTLKLNQVIGTDKGPHHIRAFVDYEGNDRVIVETQGGDTLLLDPNDENRVVFSIGPRELFGQAYQVAADPAGKHLYIDLVLGGRGVASELMGAVAKVDLETGRATYITNVGMYPNGFAFTQDGRFTYVADASGDRVYKIDNATDKTVGSTQAAVPGPYDIALNLDESELWVVGKGEMTFNLGGSLGLINTKTFRAVNAYDIGGRTIDHDIMNPANPDEMWVTSSGTAETIVWDMVKKEVTARIASANGGDTHSGAFVRFEPDFTAELLADKNGPRGSFMLQQGTAMAP